MTWYITIKPRLLETQNMITNILNTKIAIFSNFPGGFPSFDELFNIHKNILKIQYIFQLCDTCYWTIEDNVHIRYLLYRQEFSSGGKYISPTSSTNSSYSFSNPTLDFKLGSSKNTLCLTLNKHFFSTSLIKANLLSRSPNNNIGLK